MSISKFETESGLISEEHWRQLTNSPSDVSSCKVLPVLNVLFRLWNVFNGSSAIQSELMESVSRCLYSNADSISFPELITLGYSDLKSLMSRLNQQKTVLTLS